VIRRPNATTASTAAILARKDPQTLFEIAVKRTKSANASIRKLNVIKATTRTSCQSDDFSVSDDEEEHPLPDIGHLNVLPLRPPPAEPDWSDHPPPGPGLTPGPDSDSTPDPMAAALQTLISNALDPLHSRSSSKSQVIDYQPLGPIHKYDAVSKNEQLASSPRWHS
jgi:hypothetical protein